MTREEWNHINDDLINVFHWIEEFEETHPDTEIQELRYHLIELYDWLQDKQIKESEKEPEKKSEDLPEYVIKALSYVNDHCNKRDCQDCIFCDRDGCRLTYIPNTWRI